MKKTSRVLLSLILLSLVMGCFPSVGYGEGPEDIKVEVETGFDNMYKYEYMTQISVDLDNSWKDIHGKVQILLPVKKGGREIYIAHSQDVNIAKGSKKTLTFPVIIHSTSNNIKVRIIDDSGATLWEDKYTISRGISFDTVAIGVLSDDIESLTYFNIVLFERLNGSNSLRNSRVVNLTDSMPRSWKLLQSLDIIIINDYNTERLDSKQLEAMKKWVENGGLLLVGTGPNYQKTLKGISSINPLSVNGLEKINMKLLTNSKGEIYQGVDELTIIDGESKLSKSLVLADEKPIAYNSSLGEGNIVTMTFDIGLSPFIDWEGKEVFFKDLLQEKIISSEKLAKNQSYYSNRYFNILQYIPLDKALSIKLILGLIGTFIILVGPINYVVLKKLDKREKAWITIPAIAIIFSLVIYIWGFSTRLNKPLVNTISIVEPISISNKAFVRSKSSVVGFRSGDVMISSESTDSILSMAQDYSSLDFNKFKDGEIALEYLMDTSSNKAELIFKKRGVWDLEYISQENTIDFGGPIRNTFVFEDNKLMGEIENLSNIDIKDAVVLYGNTYDKLGDVNKGEEQSVALNFSSTSSTTIAKGGGIYDIINRLYPYRSQGIDKENILNDRIKRDIIEGFINEISMYMAKNNLILIGWSSDTLVHDIIVNNTDVKRVDRNLIIIPIQLQYEKGDVIEIPEGIIQPSIKEVKGLHFDVYSQIYEGNGSLEISFNPDIDMEIQSMTINFNGSLSSSKNINVSVYNYETEQWDSYTDMKMVLDDNNKDKYYSEEEGARVLLQSDENRPIFVPTFSVKGVVK